MFYRINQDENAVIFENEGEVATKIAIDNLYPVGSDLSTLYEHPEGIILSLDDAQWAGIPEEFDEV